MMPTLTEHRILIVDDEPDIHAVTKLSLKTIRYRGKKAILDSAASGKEAVTYIKEHPDTAVVLLDVVMESQTAGLDACRAIREELGNKLVRILLRTGQPGVAPERKTIEDYDIDGYLAKTELTSHKLYASVRTAIKAYEELVELERHREALSFVLKTVLAMRSFEPLDTSLQRVLAASVSVAPTPLALLELVTVEDQGNPRRVLLKFTTDDASRAGTGLEALAGRISAGLTTSSEKPWVELEGGVVIPMILHRDLGHGWIYVQGKVPDQLALQALTLLAQHAANALYSTVAQMVLRAREEAPLFEELSI